MNDLTKEIKRLLDMPVGQVDVNEAATLLLRINRNKIMYNNLLRRKNVEKILYELRKHYDFRLKHEVLKNSKEIEKAADMIIKENPELDSEQETEEKAAKGKREDHDQLPEEVQAYFLENLNIFRKMRKLHEQLKLMSNQQPCDRYPFLEELLDLDKKHRENWNKYDSYVIDPAPDPKKKDESNPPPPDPKIENSGQGQGEETETKAAPDPKVDEKGSDTVIDPAPDPKKVSAARKYLSDNKKKVSNLTGEARDALLAKMQERYDYLVKTDAGVSEQQKNEFAELGLNV